MSIITCVLKVKDYLYKKVLLYDLQHEKYEDIGKKRSIDVALLKNQNGYAELLDIISKRSLERLKTKSKIRVCFVLSNASMWSCDELYTCFKNDKRFDPYVVLLHEGSRTKINCEKNFELSKSFFDGTDYKTISVAMGTPRHKCYTAMGTPDIVFYLTPYNSLLPTWCNLSYLPQKVLSIYIPYSYMLSEAPGKFDSPGMSLSWRHFADSEYYMKMLIASDSLKTRNTLFVGYPKMDIYYEKPNKCRNDIWKFTNPENSVKVKCIIYAPHHSLPESIVCTQHFSTFHLNYKQMLAYARNNQDTTSWIIKPHPALRTTVVETGLFKSGEEYDSYLREWDSLPNARVAEEATYYDIFKTSDAMILDSVSFIAEYQFTHKPLLFLTKEDQNFNEFGSELQKVLYHAHGDDMKEIISFINDVVINGNDYMLRERQQFFEKHLNYRRDINKSASVQIYEHICKEIYGESITLSF